VNTPAHVFLNELVLARSSWRPHWKAVLLGAALPDLPLVAFYAYQRLFGTLPEAGIWSQAYFEPSWQALFDAFHSFPLILLGALLAWRLSCRPGVVCFASMGLHSLTDFLVHHADAHAHFFPLSSWRFRSPVSYWDPAYHGQFMMAGEILLVLVGSYVLTRAHQPKGVRLVGAGILALYVSFAAYAFAVWG